MTESEGVSNVHASRDTRGHSSKRDDRSGESTDVFVSDKARVVRGGSRIFPFRLPLFPSRTATGIIFVCWFRTGEPDGGPTEGVLFLRLLVVHFGSSPDTCVSVSSQTSLSASSKTLVHLQGEGLFTPFNPSEIKMSPLSLFASTLVY